jgi:phenylalanyl-tRNA synthetase alpha chain
MKNKIQALTVQIQEFLIKNEAELEQFRIKFLGTKGLIKELFNDFKSVPNEEKKRSGAIDESTSSFS